MATVATGPREGILASLRGRSHDGARSALLRGAAGAAGLSILISAVSSSPSCSER